MINLRKVTKKKINKIVSKPISKLIAKYIGDAEVYFPRFKKIVNKGDLIPEISIEEAKKRRDFIVVNERKD